MFNSSRFNADCRRDFNIADFIFSLVLVRRRTNSISGATMPQSFFYCTTHIQRICVLCVARHMVLPGVCASVTRRHSVETAKWI